MSTKREPVGVRCTPIRQGNGTYYVHMRRSGGSQSHGNGEYFGNGRFTVDRRPDGDIVRARLEEEDTEETVTPVSGVVQYFLAYNGIYDWSFGVPVTYDRQTLAEFLVDGGWGSATEGDSGGVAFGFDDGSTVQFDLDRLWFHRYTSVDFSARPATDTGNPPFTNGTGPVTVSVDVWYGEGADIGAAQAAMAFLETKSYNITMLGTADKPTASTNSAGITTSMIATFGYVDITDQWTSGPVAAGFSYHQFRNWRFSI